MKKTATQKRALILACKELDHVRRPGKLAEHLSERGYLVDIQCFSKDPKVESDGIEFTEISYVSRLEILYDKYLRFVDRDGAYFFKTRTFKSKIKSFIILPIFWAWKLAAILLNLVSLTNYDRLNKALIEALKSKFRQSKYRNFAETGETLIKASAKTYDLILSHDVYPLDYAVKLKAHFKCRLWFDIVDHPFIRSYMDGASAKAPSQLKKEAFLKTARKADFITTSLHSVPDLDIGETPIEVISNFHSICPQRTVVSKPCCRPAHPAFIMAGNHFRSTGVLRAISFIEAYGEPCSLEIIGRFIRPAYEAEVQSAVKARGLESNVNFHPALPPAELREKLMKKTAVLVPFDPSHPNLVEILPNRLFDAMRSRIPVMAQKGTATGNWVAKNKVGIATDFFNSNTAVEDTQNYLKQADTSGKEFLRVNEIYNWETEVKKLDPYL